MNALRKLRRLNNATSDGSGYELDTEVPHMEWFHREVLRRQKAVQQRVAKQTGFKAGSDELEEAVFSDEEYEFLSQCERLVSVAAHALGAAVHMHAKLQQIGDPWTWHIVPRRRKRGK